MRLTTPLNGTAEDTILIACTDLVQAFTAVQLASALGNRPIGCLITVEGQQSIRYGFNTALTQGAEGSGAIGHILYAAQYLILNNPGNIRVFNFINMLNGQDAFIQVSMMYEIGG